MTRRSFLGPAERLILIRDGFYSPDSGCRRRAAVLLALDRGSTLTGAARSAKCNRSTVYRWLSNYLENRDVAALGDGRRRFAGHPRRRQQRLAGRADTLAALAASRPETPPGRLGLDPRSRAALAALAVDPAAPPRTRYRAALLHALDRGATVATITRAVGCDRATVADAPRLHLRAVLAAAGG